MALRSGSSPVDIRQQGWDYLSHGPPCSLVADEHSGRALDTQTGPRRESLHERPRGYLAAVGALVVVDFGVLEWLLFQPDFIPMGAMFPPELPNLNRGALLVIAGLLLTQAALLAVGLRLRGHAPKSSTRLLSPDPVEGASVSIRGATAQDEAETGSRSAG